jgi:hypothetical protein
MESGANLFGKLLCLFVPGTFLLDLYNRKLNETTLFYVFPKALYLRLVLCMESAFHTMQPSHRPLVCFLTPTITFGGNNLRKTAAAAYIMIFTSAVRRNRSIKEQAGVIPASKRDDFSNGVVLFFLYILYKFLLSAVRPPAGSPCHSPSIALYNSRMYQNNEN